MIDATRIASLKLELPALNLSQPSDVAGYLPVSLQEFLEFYGFYETLKEGGREFYIGYCNCNVGDKAYRVSSYIWQLPKPSGTVFLIHGLFDHVGLFLGVINHFLQQGYSVVAIDLPGHGLSSGEPTVIESFKHYGEVAGQVLTELKPQLDGPILGVGQSTGAAVLMSMEFSREKQGLPPVFERLAFLGPLVRPRQWWAGRLAYKLFGNILNSVERDFASPNSHDEGFLNFLRYQDPLQARQLSVSWVAALYEWIERFDKQPIIDTPLLVIQGTADNVVDWKYNVEAIKAHFTCTQVNFIEGAMHHLVNEGETWRNAVFASLSQFFKQKNVCSVARPKASVESAQ